MEHELFAIAYVLGLAILLGLILHGTYHNGDAASSISGVRNVARPRAGGHLGHVCVGLGKHTTIPVWLWRFVFVMLLFAAGVGFVSYLMLWIFLPVEVANEDASKQAD
ncbi:PspC domain-containing protein [Novipirellula sp. SH528]|uniref:PspC domain-containing protein n=1 Tax=Novipirellula sp. SH528 TaxID=3454466 RepID=UPI003FA133C3